MRKLTLLIGLLALISLASATNIESEYVEFDLQDNSVEKEVEFGELTSSRMTYITNHPVDNLRVEIDGEEADCFFEELSLGGEISCETDVYTNFTADIHYTTSGLTTNRNNANIFRYSQNVYRPTDQYTFRAVLPEGTGVVNQENDTTPVIDPEFGEVGSEGRRIHVEWTQDPELGETIAFEVAYEELGNSFRNAVIGLAALILLAGFARAYLKRKSDSDEEKVKDKLTEDQRLVVEMLEEEESMLQKDIVEESEYSKAKISGLVSELEELEILSKEKEGRSNRVTLE
ncbi:MAG: hypothetical protein R6V35_03900 [Candidatus Nanohaloarchaea archaeon]